MLQQVGAMLKKPFAPFLEQSGTDLEPEPSECQTAPRDGTSDKPLFRLFVGWVPKLFTERDLLPLFQKFGDVKDIIILKDKVTGQPRGCAFVSYATKEEAAAAIVHLNKGVHLPGALCPMEVRYARSHQYVQAGTGPEDNRQLFFAHAPPSLTEEQLKQLFERVGQVEEVNLFRERRTHVSKGCGFITMHTREQAIEAMSAFDEKLLLDGSTTPLAVKWADPLLQIKKRRAVEDSNAENRMLFFAKVLRSASEDEVCALFNKFGRVIEVNLFRAFQGAPTTKGCGLVTMGSNDEAAAAIEALDAKHVWEGMEVPMVVKWMDAALQKRRREEHLAAMRQGLVPSMAGSDLRMGNPLGMSGVPMRMGPGAGLSQGKLLDAAAAAAAGMTGEVGSSSGSALQYTELLPAGCAADAYKLFVGNVPHAFTEEELRPVFETIGPVVELVVVRDKFTHESKGSAFVWYTNKADADKAVVKFNLQRVLSDPTGEQDRPLVVRRANMRKPAAQFMMMGGGQSGFSGQHASPFQGAAGMQAAGMSSNSAMSSGSNLAIGMSGMSHGGSGTLELQQPGSIQQLGLGAPQGPFLLQPMMTHMQAQQQQMQQMQQQQQQQLHQQQHMQQQNPSMGVMYTSMNMQQQQQALAMQQQPSNSDNSGSGSFMVKPFGAQQQQGSKAAAAGMPSPVQPHQQQAAYLLSQQALQPGMYGQPPPGTVAGLGLQQQPMGDVGMGGPMVNLSLQVTSTQFSVVSNQLYNISAMSGASLSSAPVTAGLFHINITGAQSQVSAARQLITSLLSPTGF